MSADQQNVVGMAYIEDKLVREVTTPFSQLNNFERPRQPALVKSCIEARPCPKTRLRRTAARQNSPEQKQRKNPGTAQNLLVCGLPREGVVPLLNSPPKFATVEDLVPRDAEGNPLTIKRKPGRPRKRVVPTVHELELAALINEQRDEFVGTDRLVRAVESNIPSAEILGSIVRELAVESAALRQGIRSAQSASKSEGVAQKMSRRIDALTKIAAITLEAHKLGLVEVDLKSEGVQRVFCFFLETIGAVAHQTLPNARDLMTRFEQALDGWEERIK